MDKWLLNARMACQDLYPMQLVLHAIPIEWLRLKINLLTFNLNHLIKNYLKIQKAKSEKILKMWEKKKRNCIACMGFESGVSCYKIIQDEI